MKVTPMLRQYFDAKDKHPDALMFFRMGDFYELFFEDAQLASEVLDITLTSRNRGEENEYPMAGVPHHAAEGYIQRLIKAGHKVAICEQLEEASKSKGIVKRDVTRVLTPGVRLDIESSLSGESNFVASLFRGTGKIRSIAMALCDVSTGELRLTELGEIQGIVHEMERAGVRELLVKEEELELFSDLPPFREKSIHLTTLSKQDFEDKKLFVLLRQLSSEYSDREHLAHVMDPATVRGHLELVGSMGLRHEKTGKSALTGLLSYLARIHKGVPVHISEPKAHRLQDFVVLDAATEANLEVFQALIGGRRAGSLISVMDMTMTAAGTRLLKNVLAYPLNDVDRINERLDVVSCFFNGETRRHELREHLKSVSDISRLTGRVIGGGANGRDLVALSTSLVKIPQLLSLSEKKDPQLLADIFQQIDPCEVLTKLLVESLVDEPPATIHEGGMFRRGYDSELDELLDLSQSGKDWLLNYEQEQKKASGIDSLKLKYNRVFGYYLEVTKANLDRVPEAYIRKQTLASSERYFTAELKEYEDKILNAEDLKKRRELTLFRGLIEEVTRFSNVLRTTAEQLAYLDLLSSFAELAVRYDYVRPEISDSLETRIEAGRHPVVERATKTERFVPNSVNLNGKSEQLLIVTGPNMAGKSTVIRQVALIALMGQVGSFVPAESASLGIVDQIFSRVGASDNLSQGLSTFMVEMTETAHILKHASEKSLVILDEIGRGTSTFDGLAIAWSVAEHLSDKISARTMFATHYHELTDLARTREQVKNVSVAVKEWNDEIVFLRKLVDGPSNRSYGIQVGRLAGIPDEVISRAKVILAELETMAFDSRSGEWVGDSEERKILGMAQLDLFSKPGISPEELKTLKSIKEIVPEELTPLDALNLIYTLKGELDRGS